MIKFSERRSGTPEAVKAWFYPGDNFGQGFVHPKAGATGLAQNTSEPVFAAGDEQASVPAPALAEAPVKAAEPSGEEVEIAEVLATESLPAPGECTSLAGIARLACCWCGAYPPQRC